MRKFLLTFALCLISSSAFAQNTTCSDRASTDSSNACANTRFVQQHIPPGAGAGGTNGQIQYNNAGAFGGFTASGDATINTGTGQVTVGSINGIPMTTTGSSTNDVLAFNGTGYIHSAITSIINTACTISPTTCVSIFGYGNVTWWGAVCNGTTDDYTPIKNAIAATPARGLLIFPSTSCAVKTLTSGGTNPHVFVISNPIHLSFPNGGGISKSGIIGILFDVQTDTFNLDGTIGTIIDGGWGATTYSPFDIAVSTNNYDTSSTVRNYITISGVQFNNWAHGGIVLWYCRTCLISNVSMNNIAYTGIMCGACQTSQIVNNRISNIWSSSGPDQPGNPVYRANHYGITVTNNLASTSVSIDVVVAHNVVVNVPAWECYDTHSGQHIVFSNNIGTGCNIGMSVVSPSPSAAVFVTLIGNQLECIALGSPVYNGSAGLSVGGSGISVAGTSGTSLAAGVNVVGNLINSCGPDNISTQGDVGAIYATFVAGLSMSSNIIYSPRHTAISLTGDYVLGSIINNTVQGIAAGPIGGTPNIFNISGTNNILNLGENSVNGSGYNGYNIASASATNIGISRSNIFNGVTSLYTAGSVSFRTDLGATAP